MSFIESSTAGPTTTLTLNRPDKLNAFIGTMREDLLAALRAAEVDDGCRVVVITGAGRAFCAGGDVEYMAALQRELEAEDQTRAFASSDAAEGLAALFEKRAPQFKGA